MEADTALTVTSLLAVALALLLVFLAERTAAARRRSRVDVGTGEDEALLRWTRAHANLAEYAPIFLILLFLAERTLGSGLWLGALAIVFLAGRLMHAYSLIRAEPARVAVRGLGRYRWRIAGMAATLLAILLTAATLLISLVA